MGRLARWLGCAAAGGIVAGCANVSEPVPSMAAEVALAAPLMLDRGALLAASCTGCHSHHARSAMIDLRTRSAGALQRALLSFRDGSRTGTVMNRIARGYDPAELRLIANHFGHQPTPGGG